MIANVPEETAQEDEDMRIFKFRAVLLNHGIGSAVSELQLVV